MNKILILSGALAGVLSLTPNVYAGSGFSFNMSVHLPARIETAPQDVAFNRQEDLKTKQGLPIDLVVQEYDRGYEKIIVQTSVLQ